MNWMLPFKAFFKAIREPEKARKFIEEPSQIPKQIEIASDTTHLRLLTYLQNSGRLIDFLKEDISSFNDAQIGSAVRKIHQDCSQILEDLVTIRPLKNENEGTLVNIPKGYNPSEFKIVGNVKGEPPFTGILVHRGWKAHKRSLPKKAVENSPEIICPAEIEIK